MSDELQYFAQTLPTTIKELHLYGFSDWHYGNTRCSIPHIDELISRLKPPNAYAILNGDLIESALRMSKGEIYNQVGSPQDQRDWVIQKLMPVRKKLLGATTGNHERRVYDITGMDITADIAYALGIPYRMDGMFLKITFGSGNSSHDEKGFTYFVYTTHGYGGARTSGAKIAKLERTSTFTHADVYIQSHDHTIQAQPNTYLIPDPRTRLDPRTGFMVGKVKEHRKLLVKTGATLKWGGYAEAGGMPPSSLGTPTIKFSGTGNPMVRVEI